MFAVVLASIFVFRVTECGLASTWDSCGCYWADWAAWSDCSTRCGGGSKYRDRSVWHHDIPGQCDDFNDCASNDMGYEYALCNGVCYNGGTFNQLFSYTGYCACIDGKTGTCCESTVDCGTPSTISNGTVSGSVFTYGATVTYSCNPGYNMTDPTAASRTCSKYGYWSGTLPQCLYAESCNSSPCKNGATCENLLGGFRCYCTSGWTGSSCSIDILPPIVSDCPDDIHVYVANLTSYQSWSEPEFSDLHGFEVHVTKNYAESAFEFPWGEYTVQYSAVKPSNGMSTECTFVVSVKPHPCDPLSVPVNGSVACNSWRTDYTNICRVYCMDGFTYPPGIATDTMFVCAASGIWMPTNGFTQCIPTDVAVSPITDQETFEDCNKPDVLYNISSTYIQDLKTSSFNAFCLDYDGLCISQDVAVRCT